MLMTMHYLWRCRIWILNPLCPACCSTMVLSSSFCIRGVSFLFVRSLSCGFVPVLFGACHSTLSSLASGSSEELSQSFRSVFNDQGQRICNSTTELSRLQALISQVCSRSSEDEILKFLSNNQSCCDIQVSSDLVNMLLQRFEDDWKSALGLFKWAAMQSGYNHSAESYDKMMDILGKAKQIDRMWLLVEEKHHRDLISLNTIAKVMRRLAGAGRWEDAIEMFDHLGSFGLEKNTESMNLLLDTLCKEKRVERAREVFLSLKSHILPNAHTFNIFIHGWCKANRVDEAHWTIQEMKGHGCCPCVISYSTIIQAHCDHHNFKKVYELLDHMQAQGCPPNVVTYTTVMHSLAKAENFEGALQIYERVKSSGCKPDKLFYNSLIHMLGRAGKLQEAVRVFEVDMPNNLVRPNSSTYNTMISMFCHHLQEENALKVLKEMEESGSCKPDLRTYDPLLKLCFKTGKTDNDLNILLDDMINKHHLSLDLSTYTLLLHGLCRANKCERAYIIFEEMIRQDIIPRCQTCRLLLDEVKQKNMNAAANRIEDLMKQLPTAK